jgi:acyl-coenzyme A thioesterase PaaI-like protein
MAPLPADARKTPDGGQDAQERAAGTAAAGENALTEGRDGVQPPREGPRALDGITRFMGLRWEDPETVRLEIRPELINRGGLLSGVVTYAMVDYCMGSTLWAHTTPDERIATITISINYIQTATEGEIVCRTVLDRRNRRIGILKSNIYAENDRLLVTAIGTYSIFPAKKQA